MTRHQELWGWLKERRLTLGEHQAIAELVAICDQLTDAVEQLNTLAATLEDD